jgi:exopolysaccharide production protein ExoZ
MKNKIESIQALRGVAVIAVVLCHYAQYFNFENKKINAILGSGIWGVDLFFIISGFVAAYSIPKGSKSFFSGMDYLVKRLIRIWPLYAFITLLSCGSTPATWLESIKSILFIPLGGTGNYFGYYGPFYGGARVGQGWTLNYEMYFYIALSFCFIFGRLKWAALIFSLSLIIAIPLIIYGVPSDYLNSGFFFKIPYLSMITHPIILEFLSGIMLGLIFPFLTSKKSNLIILICLSGVLFFLNSVYNASYNHFDWWFPCFTLLFAAISLEKIGYTFKPRLIMYLGALSYSIYLLHLNIQNIFIKIFDRIPSGINDNKTIFFISSIFLTIFLSHFSYKLIEVKTRRYLQIKWDKLKANLMVFPAK